jgi:hypothetical protein
MPQKKHSAVGPKRRPLIKIASGVYSDDLEDVRRDAARREQSLRLRRARKK